MNMEETVQQHLRNLFQDDTLIFDKSRFAGGLTNYNYIMEIHGKEYVVRQPGKMTDLMIDRFYESVNSEIVADYDLDSTCVYFDRSTGIKVSEYLPDAKNIAQRDPNDPENIRTVATLIRKLHTSATPFPNTFRWDKELIRYEGIIRAQQGATFFNYPSLKERLFRFIQPYAASCELVPCHNDTVPENFLIDSQKKGYLIDWEYSGMNDVTWDLAVYMMESQLHRDSIDLLLEEYYQGRKQTPDETMKMKSAMMAQDLLWAIWALIRHYSGEDFLDYYSLRYDRFQKNLTALEKDPDFPLHEIVRRA